MQGISLEHVEKIFRPGRGKEIRALSDVSLDVEPGERLAILGPSGAGKSTLLRIIAGIQGPTSGSVRIGGRDVLRDPPASRGLSMVFQSPALFPHYTVRHNMALSLRKSGLTSAEIESRVRETAAILEIEDLLDRSPRQISGGQQQRVSLGRALAARPRILLLDEPFSSLDAPLRTRLRTDLLRIHARFGMTVAHVTHDQSEALAIGQRIAVMHDGRVEQCATGDELLRQPLNSFVAGFVGDPARNLLPGIVGTDGHQTILKTTAGIIPLPTTSVSPDREVLLAFRPEDCAIGGNGLDATVELVEPRNDAFFVHLRVGDIRIACLSTTPPPAGHHGLRLHIDTTRTLLFDRATGKRIA